MTLNIGDCVLCDELAAEPDSGLDLAQPFQTSEQLHPFSHYRLEVTRPRAAETHVHKDNPDLL